MPKTARMAATPLRARRRSAKLVNSHSRATWARSMTVRRFLKPWLVGELRVHIAHYMIHVHY